MPKLILPEIRFRASGVVLPTVLFHGVPLRSTLPLPFEPFGKAAVPAGLVPMKFPAITLPLEKTSIPLC